MKLKWEGNRVTTPAEIETHNNMVETLWKWRHAGLVVETDPGERLPELIDAPKHVVTCACGNDDLHKFTLMSLRDAGTYAMNAYGSDGKVEATWCDTETVDYETAVEIGIARKVGTGTREDGSEYDRYEWLWILKCDKCKTRQKIWGNALDAFVEFY